MTLSTTILTLFAAATAPVAPATASAITPPPAHTARAAASAKSGTPVENLRALVQGLAANDTDLVSVLRDSIAR